MIVISGVVWTVVGILLMTLGMHHLMDAMHLWDEIALIGGPPVLKTIYQFVKNPQQAMVLILGICFLVGYLKGHYVLNRSVKSGVQRILSYPNPSEIKTIYSKKYYFLIAGMMLLGMALKILKIPADLHGMIDLAVGSALLKGALSYFKYALAEKKGTLAQEKW